MNVTIRPTRTGGLMIAEALEAQAETMRATEGYTPRAVFLLDIAHQVRAQTNNEPRKEPQS